MPNIINAARHFFSSKPTQATFLITDRCNSRCNWCNSWKRPLQKELTTEEIAEVFPKLYKFGVRLLILAGGEPLVRKDIFEVTRILTEIGFEVTIATNGILLDSDLARRLFENRKIRINVSLDTLDKEKYKAIRGIDGLDVVLKNLLEIKKNIPNKLLRVTMTISNINVNEIEEIFNFCKENHLFFSPNPYFDKGEYRVGNKLFIYDKKIMAEHFKEVTNKFSNEMYFSGFNLVYDDLYKWFLGENRDLCGAGTSFIWVGSQGQVGVCQDLSPFCNILTDDIDLEWKKRKWLPVVRNCCNNEPCYLYCSRGLEVIRNNKMKFVMEILNPIKLIKNFRLY